MKPTVAVLGLLVAFGGVAGCKKSPPKRDGLVCGEPDKTFVKLAQGADSEASADSKASDILKFAVKAADYECCVAAGKCPPRSVLLGPGAGCTVGVDKLADHPANCVSYAGAEAYCRWIGGRLPDKATWERAAASKQPHDAYPWGPAFRANLANCDPGVCRDKFAVTAPVTAFPSSASAIGAVQMAGNVFEWTSTWYEQPESVPADLRVAKQSYRVLKGGSWREHEHAMRIQSDHYKRPDERLSNIGFRCVR